jgi:carbamoyl-phosphate synthase large subunit
MNKPIKWLASTIGKRGYIARYLREASPPGSLVYGTGNERFTPGFMSCDHAFVVPGIHEQGYIDALVWLCDRHAVDAIVCLSDLDIAVLATARDRFTAMGVKCFFPDHETAIRFLDKRHTHKSLIDKGFYSPATFTDLNEAIEVLGFPLVIKPARGSASIGFGIFDSHDSANKHWHAIPSPIAQEVLRGRLVNVEACSDCHGRLLGVSAWARHQSVAGETLLAETIEHEAAIQAAIQLLKTYPIPGPIDIDMVEIDGRIYFLEVNTRFGGGYPVSHLAGADFPGLMVNAMAGHYPDNLVRYRTGVSMMKELYPVVYDTSRLSF